MNLSCTIFRRIFDWVSGAIHIGISGRNFGKKEKILKYSVREGKNAKKN